MCLNIHENFSESCFDVFVYLPVSAFDRHSKYVNMSVGERKV